MAENVFERFSPDRMVVPFDGAEAGSEPLTWGQKAIWQDMRDSGNQFSMGGRLDLPEGSTIDDAAARLTGMMVRHAALRMRLGTDEGRPCQDVAGSGRIDLEILTAPDDIDRADVARYAAELMDAWPLARFDFHRDWPLRMAVVRHRGACVSLVWVLSHLVADGGAHLLFLDDLIGNTGRDPRRPDTLDVARGEQEAHLRQLSTRAMRHWESQLRNLAARRTFGDPSHQAGDPGQRYQQIRLCSPAAHLAMLAIARRTGTDAARVTLAAIAIAVARATGVNPLTFKVMVNNRFRSGLSDVIASIAQNSVLTIDAGGTSVDGVVARARGASLTAGMRAYYDPDELAEVMARLDAERGHPAAVTCRVNDQRAMVMREDQPDLAEVTPQRIRQRLEETTLTWLGPRHNAHEQANILIENRAGVVSLYLIWDRWSLTDAQAEAMLRGVEAVAVEAAFDPAAPTMVQP